MFRDGNRWGCIKFEKRFVQLSLVALTSTWSPTAINTSWAQRFISAYAFPWSLFAQCRCESPHQELSALGVSLVVIRPCATLFSYKIFWKTSENKLEALSLRREHGKPSRPKIPSSNLTTVALVTVYDNSFKISRVIVNDDKIFSSDGSGPRTGLHNFRTYGRMRPSIKITLLC